MSMEITIQVPTSLWEQLQRVRDQLPEVLEFALREVTASRQPRSFQDEDAIMELLASRPLPEQVLSIRPSAGLQERVSELLQRNKDGTLSRREEAELERHLTLEHLVRLAKAHAYQELAQQQ